MPTYEQGTLGKLTVQDWNNIIGYPDEPILYILTKQQAAALVAICPPLKWRTRWENPPDKDTRDAFVAETMFNLMNPITCAMLQACLGELFEAQTQTILTQITNLNNFGTMNPGLPLTTEQREENLAGTSNPGCDLSILWAQCLAIVDYTNASIEDTLEKVEAATNLNELAGLSGEIPLIGWVLELFGEELATETINYFQEAIQESYLAQYTEEVRIELACALFCLGMFDCAISVNTVYDLLYDRVQAVVPDNPAAMIDLLESLAGIDFDGTNVVDLMFWFCWGGVKLASFAVGEPVTTEAFTFLMALAVDDASADYLLYCDCGSDWNYQLDSTTDPAWVTFPGGQGEIGGNVIVQTTTVQFSQDVTGIYIEIEFPTTQHLTGIRINALDGENIELIDIVNSFWAMDDSGASQIAGGALPVQDGAWEVFIPVDAFGVKKVRIAYVFLGTDQTMVWQPVQLFGFGVNPFI